MLRNGDAMPNTLEVTKPDLNAAWILKRTIKFTVTVRSLQRIVRAVMAYLFSRFLRLLWRAIL